MTVTDPVIFPVTDPVVEAGVDHSIGTVRRLSEELARRTRAAATAIAELVVDPADPAGQVPPRPAGRVTPGPAAASRPATRPATRPVAPPATASRPATQQTASRPAVEGATRKQPVGRLVPVLGFWTELALRAATLAAAAAAAWFWLWWVSAGAGAWSALTITGTVILGWIFAMPFYFLFFACRMTRTDPATPIPDLRVAMVVTKAPAEPWPVVVRTLEAMLAQEGVGRGVLARAGIAGEGEGYDVWLADESPDAETLRWCLERGVRVASRRTEEDYQRVEWPRRTRSKEGNLAFFYDRVGYDAYDVVVQLDADHVPARDYLAAMLRPFADPGVGYVAAPSICDANQEEGWTVRGRLYKEATLHGPAQAGANGGWAPLCIGSHYAVRTEALRRAGGLGPELAEDYATTLWIQSAGWDGVFALDAEAHGDGPESFDEMTTQEIQWARSLGTIAARWAPGRLGRLGWRAQLHMAFALAFYPLQGVMLTVATALPVIALLTGRSWGNTSFLSFYVHLWPFTAATLASVTVLRRSGVLRPAGAKLFSWEVSLFQMTRWVWNLHAFVQGVRAGRRRRTRPFKVTPKGSSELKNLSARYLLPTLVLAVLPAAALAARGDGPVPLGPAILGSFESALYLAAATAVVGLHIHQNVRRRRRLAASGQPAPRLVTRQTGGAAIAAVVGTALLIAAAVAIAAAAPLR